MTEGGAASIHIDSIPIDLATSFNQPYGKGVVAFVGSGPSIASGLPQWENLLLGIARACQRDREVQASLTARQLLDVAQYLAHETSETSIREKAAQIIQASQPKHLTIQTQIVALPWAGVVTTNYDHLLVMADTDRKFAAPISHRTSGLREHLRQRFMFHLHGHVGDPHSIILTKAAYDAFALGENPQTLDFVRGVFQSRTVLFIGFGFRDENIDSMLRAFSHHEITSYWSVFAVVHADGEVDQVRDHALRRRNINPIYIDCTLSEWLQMLNQTVTSMNAGVQFPVLRELSPSLSEKLSALLDTSEYAEVARTALRTIERVDLRHVARQPEALNWMSLLNRIDGTTMRGILRTINDVRRHDIIENALTCLPPRNQ